VQPAHSCIYAKNSNPLALNYLPHLPSFATLADPSAQPARNQLVALPCTLHPRTIHAPRVHRSTNPHLSPINRRSSPSRTSRLPVHSRTHVPRILRTWFPSLASLATCAPLVSRAPRASRAQPAHAPRARTPRTQPRTHLAHAPRARTPRTHPAHTLRARIRARTPRTHPRTHFAHALGARTPRTHSAHALRARTPRTHSAHHPRGPRTPRIPTRTK
jgi:hypothetical protein